MTVLWTRSAQNDLDQIYGFIGRENPGAAARLQDKLIAAGEGLGRFAGRGRLGRAPGTRELVVIQTAYLIVYAEAENAAVIVRVLHGARRWPPTSEVG